MPGGDPNGEEVREDDCNPNPCPMENSVCTNLGDMLDYTYTCAWDDCNPNPCLEGAACLNTGDTGDLVYRCTSSVATAVGAQAPSTAVSVRLESDYDAFVADFENQMAQWKTSMATLVNDVALPSMIASAPSVDEAFAGNLTVTEDMIVVVGVRSGSVEVQYFVDL